MCEVVERMNIDEAIEALKGLSEDKATLLNKVDDNSKRFILLTEALAENEEKSLITVTADHIKKEE